MLQDKVNMQIWYEKDKAGYCFYFIDFHGCGLAVLCIMVKIADVQQSEEII